MTRDEFVDLVLLHCEDSPAGNDAGEEILQEFDRLTAINKQLVEALIDFMRMVEEHSTPILLAHSTTWGKAHAAIRAAEEH